MSPTLPRLIALCGNPLAGKSTAAEILRDTLGYEIADDGLPLRRIAMDYLGLTEAHVFTQTGKQQTVEVNERDWIVRDVLGEIGNAFEEKFGSAIIPQMTHRTLDPGKRYVMASVRRDQGLYWAAQGALVLEIINPQAGPSPFEFDSFNPAPVACRVLNDGLACGATSDQAKMLLRDRLHDAVAWHSLEAAA
jgi:hypothetical protein